MMRDYFLRAGNAGAFAAAFPWLREDTGDGGRDWVRRGAGFLFDPIGAVVLEPPTYAADETILSEGAVDERFHAILRADETIDIDPQFIVSDIAAPRSFGPMPIIPDPNDPDTPEPVVPAVISDRQFFEGLAVSGLITEEEALEAVGPGVIPAAMESLIDQLPEDQRFKARMLIRGATTYERHNPFALLIGQLYGWNDQALDAFWTSCADL